MLEGVPSPVAAQITEAVDVPTIGIGIGAGPDCDGQVLVFHDVLGLEHRVAPKFVRRYADLHVVGVDAMPAFAADVRSGAFPSVDESYWMADDEVEALGLYGATCPILEAVPEALSQASAMVSAWMRTEGR